MLIKADSPQDAVEPSDWRFFVRMRMGLELMRVRMRVNIIAVDVEMRMDDLGGPRGLRAGLGNRTQKAHYVHQAENDQHESHGEFHAQTDSRWNDQIEENDERADNEDRDCVTDSPKCADQCRAADIGLTTDDGCDSYDVIGIGGVTHAKKKSQSNDGKEANHVFTRLQGEPLACCFSLTDALMMRKPMQGSQRIGQQSPPVGRSVASRAGSSRILAISL
jgi:hypothetical protein